jgi:outer membrane protein insertion porin family
MKLKQTLILLIITLLSSFLSFAEEEQKFLAAVSPTAEQTTNQAGVKTEEPAATAQTKIKNIVIEGNERTEDSTILSYIQFHAGGNFTQQKSEESLRALYGTGLFSDVNITLHGHTVKIKLIENPIINKIVFEGNDAIKSETLLSEIYLKSRMVLSKAKIQSDTNRIVELYNKSGRFGVVVNPQIIELSQNRVNLVFEIREGKKAKISKILFIGNKHFSSSKLQSVIMSKEHKFYNFFANTDHYDADLVEHDKLLLTRFYNSQGYANFRITSATADIVPAKNVFYITFSIEEGDKYKFGQMSVESQIPQVNTDFLIEKISTKEGETFNSNLIEETTEKMLKLLANNGYPFVNIDPIYDIDETNKTINIKYVIGQARKVYIGKINIRGNLKTYDEVIRREFRIAEGDPYNEFLLNRSEQRINNLDFFSKVSVKPQRTDRPDIVDINVDVEEKSTASLKLSVGYSTTDGVFGMIGLTEKNFVGKGQELSAGITKSASSFGANVGFTEPYFMNQNLSAGFELFTSTQNNNKSNWGASSNSLGYNKSSTGGLVNFGYEIMEYLYHNFGYTLEQNKISGIPDNAPVYIKEQSGTRYASILNQGFAYDRTDNQIVPKSGYLLKLNQSLAGLGGNSKYIKNVLSASYYYPLMKETVTLKVAGSTGTINSLGQSIRVDENFYLGDASFRGFEYGGIGPRDKTTQDALGGTMFYKGTTELTFPLGLPEEFDVSGAVFSDFGNVWNIDLKKNSGYSSSQYYNSKSIRASAGIGFLWITKMGPLRIDFAKAVKREKFDKTQLIHFSFSTNF